MVPTLNLNSMEAVASNNREEQEEGATNCNDADTDAASIHSTTSSRASSTVSDVVRRITQEWTSLFTSSSSASALSGVHQNHHTIGCSAFSSTSSTTDDNSSVDEDDHFFASVFDDSGVEKTKKKEILKDNNNNNTVVVEQHTHSAWFSSANNAPMIDDDYSVNMTSFECYEDDNNSYYTGGMITEIPSGLPPPSPSPPPMTMMMMKKQKKKQNSNSKAKNKNRSIDHEGEKKKKQKKGTTTLTIEKYFRDQSTFGLFVICLILLFLLAIMMGAMRPFQNVFVNNNNNDNHNHNDTPTVVPATDIIAPTPRPTTTTTTTTIDVNNGVDVVDVNTGKPTMSPPQHVQGFVDDSPVVTTVNTHTRRPTRRPTIQPQEQEEDDTQGRVPPEVEDKVLLHDDDEVPPLEMGPMVGHTTYNSVTLWAYHAWTNYTMEILLYDESVDDEGNKVLRSVEMAQPRREHNNAIITTLTNLEPATEYRYKMHIHKVRVGSGRFRTPPRHDSNKYLSSTSDGKDNGNNDNDGNDDGGGGEGSTFDYILTSCMNHRQYKNQLVWDEIINTALNGRYPDFTILAGDTIYLQDGVDVTDDEGVKYDRVWFRNWEQRNEPHFANYIRNVPMYTTWNDHEYGSNNANWDQQGKDNSLQAFQDVWANPGYGDLSQPDTKTGVYYSYYWGDVHFIVTDDHWYRNPVTENRLGVTQTKWLETELRQSRGTFKVIVIGSDIMQRGWSSDLFQIGDIVREHAIAGVLFHAGDIHRNEYKRVVTGGFPYPVTQITSSGVAKVWRRPFVHIHVDTTLTSTAIDDNDNNIYDPSMTASFYGANSTADVTTWYNDPNLRCSSIVGEDRDKEHTCTERIHLSELTVEA